MLSIQNIETGYDAGLALFGVSLEIKKGEVVALLGRNGMGKTTTIRSIIGLNPPRSGKIFFDGKEIQDLPSYEIARLGIGLVPEGRQIFPTLSVVENLLVVAANHTKKENPYDVEHIFSIFPKLKTRQKHLGGNLSGGEQQMLAIGRALMTNPSLLLLDEATEGLAPLICEEIWRGLDILKSRGLSILVIDKDIKTLTSISDRTYILEKGKVVWSGQSDEQNLNKELTTRYLGV
ncbi:MAG: ABC transporter ATP-binding protein [Campylobacterota bacterium]|nr:ABC transporter ATP-binding protein [Campylobacterota bacterium]